MTPITIGIIGFFTLLLLLALGVHVAVSMAIIGFIGLIVITSLDGALGALSLVPYQQSATYAYTVLPLFILMGEFAFHGGLTEDLFKFAHKWFGRLPGGLALATTAGCAMFAAASGSSVATAAAMGKIALPEMKRYNYDPSLTTGCIAASGTLGVLIPPSGMMIILAIVTGQSVGRLLLAGFLPGILSAFIYMAMILIRVKLNPTLGSRVRGITWKESLITIKGVWGIGALFLLIMGGIYLGIFTPTEAAAVGAFGAFLLALVRKRGFNWPNFREALWECGSETAMIFVIIICCAIFSKFIAATRLTFTISEFLVTLPLLPTATLLLVCVMYIPLGMFVDPISMVVVTLPIIWPGLTSLGFNPVLLGIIIIKLVEVACITPPLAMNIYIIKGISPEVPLGVVVRGVTWFFLMDILTIVILICFPQITLYLPNTMMGT